jgi:gluconolactonase
MQKTISQLIALLLISLGLTVISSLTDANAQDKRSTKPKSNTPKIVPLGEIEKVATGFRFTEGPAWDPDRGNLYFSDIPANTIHRIDAEDAVTVLTKNSRHANGLLVDSDGRLLACEMDGNLVSYDLTSNKRKRLANTYNDKRFNAPNDLVIDRHGGIYFTDPVFSAPDPLPQTVQSVYYRSTDGKITRVTGDIAAPNGIGLSPDGNRLYVSPTFQSEMLVYQVKGPGSLGQGQPFCQLTQPAEKENTGGDGIVIDVEGNVYFTTQLGVEIFSPSGDSVGLVRFPEQPANVTFAGTDRKTMVVTARTSVYRVKMPIAGLAPN